MGFLQVQTWSITTSRSAARFLPKTFNLKNPKWRWQLNHKPTFHNKNEGTTVKFRVNQARFTTHKAETLPKEGDVSDRQRVCVRPCKISTLFMLCTRKLLTLCEDKPFIKDFKTPKCWGKFTQVNTRTAANF